MKKFRNTEEPKINNDSSDHRWTNGAGPGGERLQTQKMILIFTGQMKN